MDGACNNRAYMKLNFDTHPRNYKFTIPDPIINGHRRVFIMDPSVSIIQFSKFSKFCHCKGRDAINVYTCSSHVVLPHLIVQSKNYI